MPIPFIVHVLKEGAPDWLTRELVWTCGKIVAVIGFIAFVKWYSSGATNRSERNLHGKVVMVTGGTSGIGAATVRELAARGAQVVLLTRLPPSDIFLIEFIEDMREQTNNELIYAEQVDLASLYSIRQFATKWIDNAPPRRLDMIILCAATLTPPGKPRLLTHEGVEENWQINYLANFHLLSILSPALRAQPADRDVRVLIATCSSYIASPLLTSFEDAISLEEWTPSAAYARSKLALMTFGQAFQKHLDAYKRPDGAPMNTRVIFVDPGVTRTPGMRRWFSRGTIWGLAVYLLTWAFSWLLLKSPEQGAQSFLTAAMEATLGRGSGGKLIKECREMDFARADIHDDATAKKLWEGSEKLIERVEREEAVRRAYEKTEEAKKQKQKQGAEKAPADKATSTKAAAETGKAKSRRARKAG